MGIGAYAGVPVLGPGDVAVGMVCVIGEGAKPDLTDEDLRIVQQVAELVARLIESSDGSADPTAAQRKAIRRVVAEQDFEVVFQAIHEVATGKVVGVEGRRRIPGHHRLFRRARAGGPGQADHRSAGPRSDHPGRRCRGVCLVDHRLRHPPTRGRPVHRQRPRFCGPGHVRAAAQGDRRRSPLGPRACARMTHR